MSTRTPDRDAGPEREPDRAQRARRRFQPLRSGDILVLTDRQAEDHASAVHGGDIATDRERR